MKVFRSILGLFVLLALASCGMEEDGKSRTHAADITVSGIPQKTETGRMAISVAFPARSGISRALIALDAEWLRVRFEEASGFYALVDLTPVAQSASVTVPVGTYCISAVAWKKVTFPYGFVSATPVSNASVCSVVVLGGQTTSVPTITLEDATFAFTEPSTAIAYGSAVAVELTMTNVPDNLRRASMDFTLTNLLQPSFPAAVLFQPLCSLTATTGVPAARSCTSAPLPLSPNPSPVNIKAQIDGSKWTRDFGSGPTLFTETDGAVIPYILLFSGDIAAL